MTPATFRALEFDRIVSVVSGLAITPTGRERLSALVPQTDGAAVAQMLRATSEGTQFLADHPGFPLRSPSDLHEIIAALETAGRALEPLRLLGIAGYLESIEQSRAAVGSAREPFPILRALVGRGARFTDEIADVRRAIEPSGEVADRASRALASIRERLRRQKSRLRSTLDALVRGRDTSKYLQEQVVTDRNGRSVLLVRAEHRAAIAGIVHGGSASGATLFVEPLETVEINNEIVELDEQEAEEVRRILLALTDRFRDRDDELHRTFEVATELDGIQARARFSILTGGIEPVIASDGAFELHGARHPLLMREVARRAAEIGDRGSGDRDQPDPSLTPVSPVPVDILLTPPARVLVITGPNTGGKTVALKTAGLLSLMAQSGLHVPVEQGSTLPIFRSVFADIGDEQSISASLSTFSAHVANVVSMDRTLALPALILLDEVGAGTDPVEGGALGTAVIDHFRTRGAHLVATTHYDSLKSYASTTEGVVSAAFGFDPETFAPSYQLLYGSPGRSLALEIAARLGMPSTVIAAARGNLTDSQQQLAEHLARVDEDLRRLERERKQATAERMAVAEAERKLRAREGALREREEAFRKRLDARLEEQVRTARRDIDAVIEGLKARASEMSRHAAVRLRSGDTVRTAGINTGELGSARADARAALDQIVSRLQDRAIGAPEGPDPVQGEPSERSDQPRAVEMGARVSVGTLGLEGIVVALHGKHAEIDVKGKRLRASLRDLRVLGGSPPAGKISVAVDLQPRAGSLTELNVIGNTVDEALGRLEKFLDASMTTDLRELRIVHGHGTGQLRRAIAAFLKEHPLVARFEAAPQNQGGGGATIVELKE